MKNHPFTGLLLSLVITLGACVYSDSGIYTVEPVPGEQAVDSITTNLDTISDPTVSDGLDLDIRYRMQVRNGEPYYVDCWLENLRIHELRFYWNPDELLIYFSDTVFTVEADTTTYVVEPDTLFMFVRDIPSELYTLEGSFPIQSTLPVEPGDHLLQMFFYYSSNTNSLADILNVEAETVQREYTINFDAGGEK